MSLSRWKKKLILQLPRCHRTKTNGITPKNVSHFPAAGCGHSSTKSTVKLPVPPGIAGPGVRCYPSQNGPPTLPLCLKGFGGANRRSKTARCRSHRTGLSLHSELGQSWMGLLCEVGLTSGQATMVASHIGARVSPGRQIVGRSWGIATKVGENAQTQKCTVRLCSFSTFDVFWPLSGSLLTLLASWKIGKRGRMWPKVVKKAAKSSKSQNSTKAPNTIKKQ